MRREALQNEPCSVGPNYIRRRCAGLKSPCRDGTNSTDRKIEGIPKARRSVTTPTLRRSTRPLFETPTKAPQDPALGDTTDLLERGILVRDPGGARSTNYSLKEKSKALDATSLPKT